MFQMRQKIKFNFKIIFDNDKLLGRNYKYNKKNSPLVFNSKYVNGPPHQHR